jgi:hypothetical protein
MTPETEAEIRGRDQKWLLGDPPAAVGGTATDQLVLDRRKLLNELDATRAALDWALRHGVAGFDLIFPPAELAAVLQAAMKRNGQG